MNFLEHFERIRAGLAKFGIDFYNNGTRRFEIADFRVDLNHPSAGFGNDHDIIICHNGPDQGDRIGDILFCRRDYGDGKGCGNI